MRQGGTRRIIRRIVGTIGVTALAVTGIPGAAQAAPGDILPSSSYYVPDVIVPQPRAMGLSADGTVWWAAEPYYAFTDGTFVLGRATASGSASPADPEGHVGTLVTWDATQDFIPQGVGVQPDGKVVVAGIPVDSARNHLGLGLVRVTPDGALDPTFDGDGRVFLPNPAGTVAPQLRVGNVVVGPTGRIMVPVVENGATQDALSVRAFGTGGKPDKTYGSQGRAVALTAARIAGDDPYAGPAGNGKVVLGAGQCPTVDPGNGCSAAAVRLTGKGVPDPTFSGDGRADVPAPASQVIPTGVRVHALAGSHVLLTADMSNTVWKNGAPTDTSLEVMARFRPDGSPNPAFGGGDGVFSRTGIATSGQTIDTAVQSDGKLVMLSWYEFVPDQFGEPFWTPVLRRFNWNGTRDTTFGTVPSFRLPNIFGTAPGPLVSVEYGNPADPHFPWRFSMLTNPDGTLTLATATGGETAFGFQMMRRAL